MTILSCRAEFELVENAAETPAQTVPTHVSRPRSMLLDTNG